MIFLHGTFFASGVYFRINSSTPGEGVEIFSDDILRKNMNWGKRKNDKNEIKEGKTRR
jgi:hypothetical protein